MTEIPQNIPDEAEIEKRRLATTSYIGEGMFVLSPLAGRVIPQLNLDDVSQICRGKGFTVNEDRYGLIIHSNSENTGLIECSLDKDGKITDATFRLFVSGNIVYFDHTCMVEYDYENNRLVEERLTVIKSDGTVYRHKTSQYIYFTDEGDDGNYVVMEETDGNDTNFFRIGVDS